MSQFSPSRDSGESKNTLSSIDDEKNPRTIVICIDRDDDIGRTGVRTPLVGRTPCLDAASKLALSDPEEADANAIFGAIRQYDELRNNEEDCEVALVSGIYERGVAGDRKIRNQVAEILKKYPADGAVLVSDGVEGEELAPIIQGVVPVISIKKIVIKHSASLEESYVVFGRYLRMLFFDSRYSKYSLGVPGAIFVALVIISYYSPGSVLELLAVIVGIAFIVRGFDIDRRIESISKLTPSGYLRLFSVIASVLIIIIGLSTGAAVFFPTNGSCTTPQCIVATQASSGTSSFLIHAPKIIGYFIQASEQFVWLGAGVYIAGNLVFNFLRPKSRHYTRYLVELFVLGLLYLPMSLFASNLISGGKTGNIDVAIILFALAVNFTIAAYLYSIISSRRRESHSIDANIESKDIS